MSILSNWRIKRAIRRAASCSKETRQLAYFIVFALQTSVDEKTAIRRICNILRLYGFALTPDSLGSSPYGDDGRPVRSGDAPSP